MRSNVFSASRYLQTSASFVAQAGNRDAAYFAQANPDEPAPTIATFLTENFPAIAPDILCRNIHSANMWYVQLATSASCHVMLNGVNMPLTNAQPIFRPVRHLDSQVTLPSESTLMHNILQYAACTRVSEKHITKSIIREGYRKTIIS